jgi:ATP-dependent Lon protease
MKKPTKKSSPKAGRARATRAAGRRRPNPRKDPAPTGRVSGDPDPPAEAKDPPAVRREIVAVFALRNSVVFPGTVVPLSVGRPQSLALVEEVSSNEKPVGIVCQRDPKTEEPGADDIYKAGTLGSIVRVITLPDGSRHVVVQGMQRLRVVRVVATKPFIRAEVEIVEEQVPDTPEMQARVHHLRELALRALELLPNAPEEASNMVRSLTDPRLLVDVVASNLDVPVAKKQEILETTDPMERYRMVGGLLSRQVEVLEISRRIGTEIKASVDKTQREYYLREQLKAIQKELGEGEEEEIATLREKIQQVKMPPDVEKTALKELDRLARMPAAAAEHSMLRTYLDWLVELPWSVRTEDALDLKKAREILDADHHDLEKVKKRILEFLAVRQLRSDMRGPILCFAGPPGVGKTSLGMSIARALGRKFVRMSLGGVHDEAEIRGHRRTYIGALPGRIIQGIRKAGSHNPVFMLDEVDKLSASFQGDPSAALLEVLDPEQNFSFSDHYLDVPFDLREVLFIGTANVLETIPPALRDRMEVLELPGYTEEDKLHIARRFLVPRQIEQHGLKPDQLAMPDKTIETIVGEYTREAGVRNLEREIATICRAVAAKVVEGTVTGPIVIEPADLHGYLGPPRFYAEVAERTRVAGVATGLAVTPAGGDILFVEATKMPGTGRFTLTGQLGDVMKESAQAAYSYLRSRTREFGIGAEAFKDVDVHIHVPAGAIPKDGPSAGVTMFTALLSLASGRRVRSDIAMTGEISLRGLVLPVGGIKEKVLAARRAGIKTVIMPERNRKDLEDIPEAAREAMTFEFVDLVDKIPPLALEPVEAAAASDGDSERPRTPAPAAAEARRA